MTDADQIKTDARAFRDEILNGHRWLSSRDVQKLVTGRTTKTNESNFASRLRRLGRLIAVRFSGQYLYPEFQFNCRSGQVLPGVEEVLRILPGHDGGWAAAFWWFSESQYLGGRCPFEVFPLDPDAVLDAARKEWIRTDSEW